ncbi:hypothetical protein Btru_028233 [Bulinus truncatus]|nr:hypothetical protein Btru_028233 [Bulinus truncatus]
MNRDVKAAKRRCTRASSHHEPVLNKVNWERLPYPATVEVIRYLRDVDRIAMSQVCRDWNNSFKNPSLWRKREFVLGGPSAKITSKKNLCFTSIFGSCLRDVTIECHHKTSSTCRIITGTLEILLKNIKGSQLCRFYLKDLELERFGKFPELKEKVARCLIKFFQSQTKLEQVRLEACQFSLSSGTKVLDSLTKSIGKELVYLDLSDYLLATPCVQELHKFQDTLTKFTNLSGICVNYSYISDRTIRHWAVSLCRKLESMYITVSGSEPHSHIISRSAWRELSASCPKLKVVVSLEDLSHANQIVPLLEPCVPLQSFFMSSDLESARETQLSATLKHLADNFKHRLEKLHLILEYMKDSIDDELIYLLERCRQLRSFCVSANLGIGVANTICDILKDKKQYALRSVHITMCPEIDNHEFQDALRRM